MSDATDRHMAKVLVLMRISELERACTSFANDYEAAQKRVSELERELSALTSAAERACQEYVDEWRQSTGAAGDAVPSLDVLMGWLRSERDTARLARDEAQAASNRDVEARRQMQERATYWHEKYEELAKDKAEVYALRAALKSQPCRCVTSTYEGAEAVDQSCLRCEALGKAEQPGGNPAHRGTDRIRTPTAPLRYAAYDEPDKDGSTVRRRIPFDEAVRRQKQAALGRHVYGSDEEAFEDFIAVHWGVEEIADAD